MDFLQQKAKAIIDCFLLSEVVPRVQVRQLPSTPYPHPQYILTLKILARQFTVIYPKEQWLSNLITSICQWNNQSYFLTICISLNLMLYMCLYCIFLGYAFPQVNIPSDLATSIAVSLTQSGPTRGLFHDAMILIFPLLYYFWKRLS